MNDSKDAIGAKSVKDANDSLERQLNSNKSGPGPGTYFCETYVVFRPWDKCTRCKDDILGPIEGRDEAGEIVRGAPTKDLPDEGDYACPHVSKAAYAVTIQKIKTEKLEYVPPTVTTLATGVVQVTVQWWERGAGEGEGEKKNEPRPKRF